MKRYHFGALLLCLSLTACSHHGGRATDASSRAGYDQTKLYDTPKSRTAFDVYREEPTGPGASEEMWTTKEAEYEKMQRTRDSRGATASSGDAVPAERQPSAASTYGDPPGAHTRPGTTRALRPEEGTREGVTPESDVMDHGTSASDRSTTQRIRRALLDDDSLSDSAKNVRIVTRDGNISLRGVVKSERERWEVERMARGFAGSGKVDNYLTIQEQPDIR